jgi:hypothetical protein
MGVYQTSSIDLAIPQTAVSALGAAIIAKSEWGDGGWEAKFNADPVEAVVQFIVTTEGGNPIDVNYQVDEDANTIYVDAYTDGKLSFDADAVEALYAEHGVMGTIDGECEGEKFRARLVDGEVLRSGGETFYTEDKNDPASVAVGAALKFVRGQISELEMVTVLSRARAATK